MGVDPSVLVDPTGRGLYDLQHRFLNTTHPDSFRDDPLRILRALRFVSVLVTTSAPTRSTRCASTATPSTA